jgi:putative flippase GtrA
LIKLEVFRFIVVGLISNIIIFLIYLLLTGFGLNAKMAMTLLYCVGVIQTFVFNKKWTFRFSGKSELTFIRYCLVYLMAYLLQLIALIIFVDYIGLAHQWVMAVLIMVSAVLIFIAQKLWVFRST